MIQVSHQIAKLKPLHHQSFLRYGNVTKFSTIIRGEPKRAPNTRETGSGEYIYNILYLFIYLCVILHGNDLMHMLRHHVIDLTMIGKGRHQRRSKVKSAELWQCSVG